MVRVAATNANMLTNTVSLVRIMEEPVAVVAMSILDVLCVENQIDQKVKS